MLSQHRSAASDAQATEAVAWDLRWKVALGLPVDHQGWHPASLTRFRARLLLHGREQLALESTLRLAEEIGLLEGTGEQALPIDPVSRMGYLQKAPGTLCRVAGEGQRVTRDLRSKSSQGRGRRTNAA
jgi:hypothetical protein